MEFTDMIGGEYKFYGVDNHCFKVGFYTFEAVEDPDDGYRSWMDCIKVKDDNELIFFRTSLATVKLEQFDEIYQLTDVEDGHIWLQFGTERSDEYYPYFVFAYQPRVPR